MSVEFEMHNFRETVLAQTRKNQKYAKNVGCRKVTKNSAEHCLYNVDWNQCRTRWKSVNSLKLRWILHRIQEPFSMHSVIDGQEPQNMLYSSLIAHFLQFGKKYQKSVPSGDPKVIFLGPCRLQGSLWVDCLGLPGAPKAIFL